MDYNLSNEIFSELAQQFMNVWNVPSINNMKYKPITFFSSYQKIDLAFSREIHFGRICLDFDLAIMI